MSYRKEDHLPPPLRTCTLCAHEFIPDRGPWQRECESCIEKMRDENRRKEDEAMQNYECSGCRKELDGNELWVCEDNKLRCMLCLIEHRDRVSACWMLLYDISQEEGISMIDAKTLADARIIISKRMIQSHSRPPRVGSQEEKKAPDAETAEGVDKGRNP